MPAKKAKPSKTLKEWQTLAHSQHEELVEGGKVLLETLDRVAQMKQRLDAAQAESGRHLTAIQKLVDEQRKERAAGQAEIEYWMAEVNRLNYVLINIDRKAARESAS